MTENGTAPAEVSEKLKLSVCLLVFAGLPGAGKSTLARELAVQTNATLFDIDNVRVELFPRLTSEAVNYEREKQQMYAAYQRMYQLAARSLEDGKPTILAATFSSPKSHEEIEKLAKAASAPPLVFLVEAPTDVLEERLSTQHGYDNNFSNVISPAHLQEVKSRFVEIKGENVFKLDSTKTQDFNLQQIVNEIERFKVR